MNATHKATTRQCHTVSTNAASADALAFFNRLTEPELFDAVELALPPHRERLFPPTETLSMFLAQALRADRSCQQAVNDAAIKRLIAGLAPHRHGIGEVARCDWSMGPQSSCRIRRPIRPTFPNREVSNLGWASRNVGSSR